MSGKRYDNVTESSSDEEYRPGRKYKNSYSSHDKYDDYEDDCKILRKMDTSSSSFEVTTTTTRKRGRGPSKRPCTNKNAQAARENRIRKKKHLEQVENKLLFYQQKNKSLVNVIEKQDIDIKKLKGEVSYLRCILKNNTNITTLLQSMNEGLNRTSNNKLSNNKSYNNKSVLVENMPNINGDSENQRILESIAERQLSTDNTMSLSEVDHTYTIPKIQNGTLNSSHENQHVVEECENLQNLEESIFGDEILLDLKKEESATSPLSNSNELVTGNISDMEIDEWSKLNVNIYDNLTKFDDLLTSSDDLNNLINPCNDSNALDQFGDAGICLHVNSNKVSLEYCSICHTNSLNSVAE